MTTTGEIVIALKPGNHLRTGMRIISFVLEVHTEDEAGWGGYARGLDPYANFKFYRKDLFNLIEDRRAVA